jgi:hypothetical protein
MVNYEFFGKNNSSTISELKDCNIIEKTPNRASLALVAAAMIVVISACSSSDAEKIVEENLPTPLARVIHLSPDAPDVDIEFKLVEVQQTIIGLGYGEASAYTEVCGGILPTMS